MLTALRVAAHTALLVAVIAGGCGQLLEIAHGDSWC